mmetsp:Transcript_130796/g.244716  ORF Transcript_130796/g.244716 Transcript_130796/m.244716 type:complete len:210 (-) Transcript_130796:606-1235(-)
MASPTAVPEGPCRAASAPGGAISSHDPTEGVRGNRLGSNSSSAGSSVRGNPALGGFAYSHWPTDGLWMKDSLGPPRSSSVLISSRERDDALLTSSASCGVCPSRNRFSHDPTDGLIGKSGLGPESRIGVSGNTSVSSTTSLVIVLASSGSEKSVTTCGVSGCAGFSSNVSENSCRAGLPSPVESPSRGFSCSSGDTCAATSGRGRAKPA